MSGLCMLGLTGCSQQKSPSLMEISGIMRRKRAKSALFPTFSCYTAALRWLLTLKIIAFSTFIPWFYMGQTSQRFVESLNSIQFNAKSENYFKCQSGQRVGEHVNGRPATRCRNQRFLLSSEQKIILKDRKGKKSLA